MAGLTDRQKEILEFIASHIEGQGYPPTMREIGGHFNITWPAARGHLSALEKKGLLRISPQKSRGIELLGRPSGGRVPIAGRIRAGRPGLAVEDIEGMIAIDRSLFNADGAFILRAVGESMKDAGILDGDYVIIRPQESVEDNEIAAVMVGAEDATLKKIRRAGESIILVPCNASMSPMEYPASEVKVIGKAIGVIRKI